MGSSVITLLISMISIQSGATIAKMIFPLVGPIGTSVLRTTLAATMLLILWPPKWNKMSRRDLLTIARYGASLGCMNLTFYLAIEKIPLGIAVALEFSGPLSIAILCSRKMSDFLWATLAIVGILLILPLSPHSFEALDLTGVFFALVAGVFWALYILFGQRISKSVDRKRATSVGMLVAALIMLPAGLFYMDPRSLTWDILPLALLLALLSSALPYSLEMIALQRIPAKTFGILLSLAPVLASLIGLFFLHEHLNLVQWFAISCIMIASLGSTLSAKENQKRETEKFTPLQVLTE